MLYLYASLAQRALHVISIAHGRYMWQRGVLRAAGCGAGVLLQRAGEGGGDAAGHMPHDAGHRVGGPRSQCKPIHLLCTFTVLRRFHIASLLLGMLLL